MATLPSVARHDIVTKFIAFVLNSIFLCPLPALKHIAEEKFDVNRVNLKDNFSYTGTRDRG
jgi:hypothetical protein